MPTPAATMTDKSLLNSRLILSRSSKVRVPYYAAYPEEAGGFGWARAASQMNRLCRRVMLWSKGMFPAKPLNQAS